MVFSAAALLTTADSSSSPNPPPQDSNSISMVTPDLPHARKSRLAVPSGGADPLIAGVSPPTSSGVGAAATGSSANASTSTRASLIVGAGGGLNGANGGALHSSAAANSINRPMQYLQRLTDVRQMDIQSAMDQMKCLLTRRPQVVYKTSYYRKQTKNHWARDDPAFVALQGVFLIIACIAYAVAFRVRLAGAISFLLYTVLWNWLGMGFLLASLCREIANRQLVVHQSNSHVRQQVEWLYAFDIHCNAFFPVFVVLYCVQFFLLPVVLGEGLVPLIVANTLYAGSLSWYWYITHLGYRTLPFLSSTEVFLFPIAAIVLLYAVMLVGYPFGFGWNAARVMARFYFM